MGWDVKQNQRSNNHCYSCNYGTRSDISDHSACQHLWLSHSFYIRCHLVVIADVCHIFSTVTKSWILLISPIFSVRSPNSLFYSPITCLSPHPLVCRDVICFLIDSIWSPYWILYFSTYIRQQIWIPII